MIQIGIDQGAVPFGVTLIVTIEYKIKSINIHSLGKLHESSVGCFNLWESTHTRKMEYIRFKHFFAGSN